MSLIEEARRKLAYGEISVSEFRDRCLLYYEEEGLEHKCYTELEQLLIDDAITVEEFFEQRRFLEESIHGCPDEDPVRSLDERFKDTYLSPEEYVKKRRNVQDAIMNSSKVIVPSGRVPILAQRLLLLVTTVFGIYFIILPTSNFYSLIGSFLYTTMIFGGILGNMRYEEGYGEYFPTVSMVIPVYNGEDVIYDVLKSHALQDYPKERIEVIVANDGSTDNTVEEIKRAIDDFPDTRIRLLSHYPNKGKRYTISNAIRQTRGNIIARADADTFIHVDATQKLVWHFCDEEIGGVTGWTKVRNLKENWLTRMQGVRYNIGFKLLYPFHNLLGSIFCLPGSFTAYRRSILERVIDQWEVTVPKYSEDRQMAHLIMEAGLKTKYVREAVVETIVPSNMLSYARQQFRWGKANTIQQLRATTFMFKLSWRLWFVYLFTYFITLTTPFAIVRLFVISHNWYWWLLLATCSAFLRGFIVEGLRFSAFYAVPLYFFHLFLDIWRVPLALATIGDEENR
ncbi:glycosyltransferase [Candidatus Bathyarchaeota archaeon]|nr:glycosyltransferase [Candidatus Bathyarchaeota archaeon]